MKRSEVLKCASHKQKVERIERRECWSKLRGTKISITTSAFKSKTALLNARARLFCLVFGEMQKMKEKTYSSKYIFLLFHFGLYIGINTSTNSV